MHVISKLVPNEFLISANSVAVAITFIVFSFTIPHTGGRGVCATQRESGSGGGDRNSETGRYLDRETEAKRGKKGEV